MEGRGRVSPTRIWLPLFIRRFSTMAMDQHNLWTGFQMPRRLAVEGETLTDRYGRFSAQPFERGFGTTIGNSLRRALLSSIEGAAITAVKIEGVEHEFSSIRGVVEDATDVILNLKQVPFKLHGTEAKTLTIHRDGAGEVTSADIEADADVEVLDPNVYIATVSEGGSLTIEMRLKRGRGYVTAERNFDEDLSLGYIPIDSVMAFDEQGNPIPGSGGSDVDLSEFADDEDDEE